MNLLELFAGAGGAALGLRAAGYEGLHYEWDPDAFAALTAAGFDGFCCDVRRARWAGWARYYGRPHLGWMSPPCQAFSQAGKGLGARDPRNLWPTAIEVARLVRPTWLVCENVPGLLQHQKAGHPDPMHCCGCYWEREVVPAIRELYPWVGVWRLNAADYGVPQTRRRVFLVAGPHPIASPKPTHAAPGERFTLFGELKPWVSIGQALGLVGTIIGGGHNPSHPGDKRTYRDLTDSPGTTITAEQVGNAGPWVVESRLAQSQRTLRTDQPATTLDCGATRDSYRAPHILDRPSPAVLTGEVKGSGKGANAHKMQRASDALWLGAGRRRLTIEECALLQGFPPGHPFQGTKAEQYRQVGNAVPPALAEAIARSIPCPPP